MRAPILPYYSEPFGVKSPIPINKTIAVGNDGMPCADSYDGSYFTVSSTSIARYNRSKTLIWTLTPVGVVAGYTHILGFYFSHSDATYYGVACYQPTKNVQLFKLASPATTNAVTLIGTTFITTDPYDDVTYQVSMWRQSDGNFRLRRASTAIGYITDTVISSAGAKVSEARVSQNSIPLQYKTDAVTYETADGTINFGVIVTNSVTYGVIIKDGTTNLVPLAWITGLAASGYISCRLWDDYVYFGSGGITHAGVRGVTIASLDEWLHNTCNAMGM